MGTAQGTANLDYSAKKTHLVTVRCTETATGDVGDAVLEVDILPNQQPVIAGYPAGRLVSVSGVLIPVSH